jgi:hypothetical protein
MNIDPDKMSSAVTEIIDKVGLALDLVGEHPLKTPALAIVLGRRLAQHVPSGEQEGLMEGIDIMCALMRRAALVENKKHGGNGDDVIKASTHE